MPIREITDMRAENERQAYYQKENKVEKALSNAKIIQVNINEIYMVGGTDEEWTLLACVYK